MEADLDLTLEQLEPALDRLAGSAREDADLVLRRRDAIRQRFVTLAERPMDVLRTRIHGDYHLGQVLVAKNDFVIIDFEGEPARPPADRRRKRSALVDVAGMVRSFQYAGHVAADANPRRSDGDAAEAWALAVTLQFLRAYLEAADGRPFLPLEPDDRRALFEAHLLEKALYEVRYELSNRPEWVSIPVRSLLEAAGAAAA